jgi:hypothetical protein
MLLQKQKTLSYANAVHECTARLFCAKTKTMNADGCEAGVRL